MDPIKTERAADLVVRRLESLILEGSLPPGATLLPERDLAEHLDVSRPTIRQGIAIMEKRGLLARREDGGLKVAELGAAVISDPLIDLLTTNAEVADDYLEFRAMAEGAAAAMAAERANEVDRRGLQERMDRIDRAHGGDDPAEDAEADAALHIAIYEATHNVVLLHVMRVLAGGLRADVLVNRRQLFSIAHTRDILREQHREIVGAILRKDPEGARAAAHSHISYLREATREFRRAETQLDTSLRRLTGGGVMNRKR
ncbi:FCD domain-containing protein [Chenggangzhangella methanolivorans]|uniref:Pyruvate dehydrogenase complex repressor n=2 Tax=Chenggangzhangella methanolivorans TaxID=1437009 RepID=A0A9E6UPH5_9HYPH|nr:FCD domain-containing protein [Chenggangzhangella methanolivorans]